MPQWQTLTFNRGSRSWWALLRPWATLAALVIAIVGPIASLVWLIFFTDVFVIHAITVVDARGATTEAIRTIVQQELDNDGTAGTKASLLFIQPERLSARVIAALPQVRSIHVQRQLPGTLKIVVQEKTPALLVLAHQEYYFVDSQGIAYERARLDSLPGIILPTVKSRNPESKVIIGGPVVSASFVVFVEEITKFLPEKVKAKVVEVTIPSLAAREVQFHLDNNWKIRFDATRPAAAQVDLLHQLVETTLTPAEKAALEYVDLRIPHRIYYKTKEAPAPLRPRLEEPAIDND